MGRESMITNWTLEAIVNDFEDLETVQSEVMRWAAGRGVPVERSEVVAALTRLIKSHLAGAFVWTPAQCWQIVADTSAALERPDCYFLATTEGRKIVEALTDIDE